MDPFTSRMIAALLSLSSASAVAATSAHACELETVVGCNDGHCVVPSQVSGLPSNVGSFKYYIFFGGPVTVEYDDEDGSRSNTRHMKFSLTGTYILSASQRQSLRDIGFALADDMEGQINLPRNAYWEETPVIEKATCYGGPTDEELRAASDQATKLAAAQANAQKAAEDEAARLLRLNNPLAFLSNSNLVAPPEQYGSGFRDCVNCPELIVLHGATFTMGSPSWEVGRLDDEGPQRRVNVQPFAMGRSEVSFAQWDECVSGGGCSALRSSDGGWGRGMQPVINVSWDEVQQYLTWLSRKYGRLYRLPTEAEWEYAARADSNEPFSYGQKSDAQWSNYDSSFPYNNQTPSMSADRPLPVGSTLPNGFHLADMHGNVWEWVSDCYGAYSADASLNAATSPSPVGTCKSRVYRGGSWDSSGAMTRSATRNHKPPGYRSSTLGFRVAVSL